MFKIKQFNSFNRKSISRLSISVLLLGIIVFMAGCSASIKSTPEDKNISALTAVLQHQFTGPDLEVIELLEKPTEFEKYYEKRYKSHFTEDMYTRFLSTNALDYHFKAFNSGYQLEVENITIDNVNSTEGAYDFKVNVHYKKNGTEQNSAEVSGRGNFNKDGKISSIRYLNDGGLLEALRE